MSRRFNIRSRAQMPARDIVSAIEMMGGRIYLQDGAVCLLVPPGVIADYLVDQGRGAYPELIRLLSRGQQQRAAG